MTQKQYIEEVAKYVQKYAPQYGIKVYSPIIAQFCLESGYGTSNKVKKVLSDGTIDWRHNYVGLKWRNNRCAISNDYFEEGTSEQNKDGSYTDITSKFFRFKSLEECVIGYFQFTNISAYANLKGVTDPETYLKNIKEDKYATSIDYVQKNMNVISKWNLTQYDKKEETKMKYKIAIDAGHGSQTAGKRTPDGYREHWINVKCANYFDIAMKRCGFETVKISWDDTDATDDTDISLGARQTQIKNSKSDISVSWHANAHGDGKTYTSGQGIETFVHSESSKVADSKRLANCVHKYLIQGTKQTNRGVKSNNFAMCNCLAMGTKASILIETAFMTNEYEASLLKTDAFCLECAEEAAKGVCEYFGVAYKNGTGTTTTVPSIQNTSTVPSRSYLMKGDKGADVKALQENLNYLGYNCGNADGDFGAKTDNALRKFQKAYKLTVDGKYGVTSKKTLEDAVAKKKNIASTPTPPSSANYTYKGVNYSIVFNPTYYSNKYADLKKAFGTNATKLFSHFCEYGMKEGRQAIDSFNVEVYKNNYADLRNAFGNDLPKYYEHWIKYGTKEGRKAK